MAATQFLLLALLAVSAYGLVPTQPYSTLQTYPVQNGYAFFYTAQLPVKTQMSYPYGAQRQYYPYYYQQQQPKETVVIQKVTVPPQGYFAQTEEQRAQFVPKEEQRGQFAQKEEQRGQFAQDFAQKEYPQTKEQQKVNYPAVYPEGQRYQVPVGYVQPQYQQQNQYYQQNQYKQQDDQKATYPSGYPVVYQEAQYPAYYQQQEKQAYYPYQPKDEQSFARYQEQYPSVPGYVNKQEQEYVYQPNTPQGYQPQYQSAQYQPAQYQPAQYQSSQYQPAQYQPAQYQSAQYQPAQYQPGQGYQPAQYKQYPYYPFSRVYAEYAPRYPEGNYQAQQEQPTKHEKTSKRMSKPTIHVKKYDDNMLGDEDFEKNYIKAEQMKH